MEQLANISHLRELPRCLLIEDSDFDQRRIARILARGVPVHLDVAPTLRQARSKMETTLYDLILLDNALPDGLGVEFAAELREDKTQMDIPILMISDWPTPFVYDKAMNARVGLVMGKDEFQPKHVREALRFARAIAMSKQ